MNFEVIEKFLKKFKKNDRLDVIAEMCCEIDSENKNYFVPYIIIKNLIPLMAHMESLYTFRIYEMDKNAKPEKFPRKYVTNLLKIWFDQYMMPFEKDREDGHKKRKVTFESIRFGSKCYHETVIFEEEIKKIKTEEKGKEENG
jgi:hypothetical protein